MKMVSLEECPLVWSLSETHLGINCSYCGMDQVSLKRCSRCKTMHYCSRTCQEADFNYHSVECRCIHRGANIPSDGIRLVLRLLIKANKGELDNAANKSITPEGRTFKDLLSHSDNLKSNSGAKTRYLEFESRLKTFIQGDKFTLKSYTDLPSMYGKTVINAFGIQNDRLRSIGLGLFVNLCRLNHSCAPSARLVFDYCSNSMPTVRVVPVTSKPFPKNVTYDMITHSYIDNLAPLEERQRKLKDDYFFECKCVGCMDAERNKAMASYCCDYENCPGFIRRFSLQTFGYCDTCGSKKEEASTAEIVYTTTENALEKLHMAKSDLAKLLTICEKVDELQTNQMTDLNVDRVKLRRICFATLCQTGDFKKAIPYGESVYKAYKHYFSRFDPWLGAFIEEYAVACINAQELAKGQTLLKELLPIFECCYGLDRAKSVQQFLHVIQESEKNANITETAKMWFRSKEVEGEKFVYFYGCKAVDG